MDNVITLIDFKDRISHINAYQHSNKKVNFDELDAMEQIIIETYRNQCKRIQRNFIDYVFDNFINSIQKEL